jgi:hypothetical protein
MISGLSCLINYIANQSGIAAVVGGALAMVCFLIVVWNASKAGTYMLATINDTAAGNDAVDWPQEPIRETFFPSLKVYYYFILAMVITYPLRVAGSGAIFWQAVCFFIFPAFLFSGLASVSWFNFLHAAVLRNIAKKIHLYLMMYVLSLAVMGLAGGLFVMSMEYAWLIPIAGIVGAACWLIYCRLLGRMAYTLTEEEPPKKKKRKRKKKLAPDEDSEPAGETPAGEPSPAEQPSPQPVPGP